jgi:hypothetical protein
MAQLAYWGFADNVATVMRQQQCYCHKAINVPCFQTFLEPSSLSRLNFKTKFQRHNHADLAMPEICTAMAGGPLNIPLSTVNLRLINKKTTEEWRLLGCYAVWLL